jgi:hypothetical protein
MIREDANHYRRSAAACSAPDNPHSRIRPWEPPAASHFLMWTERHRVDLPGTRTERGAARHGVTRVGQSSQCRDENRSWQAVGNGFGVGGPLGTAGGIRWATESAGREVPYWRTSLGDALAAPSHFSRELALQAVKDSLVSVFRPD